MRIAFAKPRRFGGGTMTVALALGKGLRDRGHDLLLLCNPVSPVREPWLELGQELAPVLRGRDFRVLPVVRSWNALRRFRADVLLAFVSHPNDMALFMPAPSWLGIPVVVRNGLAGSMDQLDGRERRHLEAADRFIAVSRQIGEEIRAALPGRPDHPRVLLNGADVDAFQSTPPADLGLPPGTLTVGFLGRLHEEKGLLDLARAWPRVAREVPEARLVIVGDGPGEEEIREAFAGLPGAAFLGRRSDAAAVHRALDVLVLPSYREGLPNAVVEAMATGVPVVATDIPGTVEVVEDGVTGRLVQPGAADALADALIALLRDGDARRRMGGAALRRARKHHDWPALLDAYEAELRAAAEGRRR